jgi:hypothetical protein
MSHTQVIVQPANTITVQVTDSQVVNKITVTETPVVYDIEINENIRVIPIDYARVNTAIEEAYSQANTATDIAIITFAATNTKVSSVNGTAGQIYSSGGTTPTINLIQTGVNSGVYGGASEIPVITVDSLGRISSAVNVSVQGMDYEYANTIGLSSNAYAQTVGTAANTIAIASFGQANTATDIALSSFDQANLAYNIAITSPITFDAGSAITNYLNGPSLDLGSAEE